MLVMRNEPVKITRTARFVKNYKQRIRTTQLKKAVVDAIHRFCEDRSAVELRDHELRHSMKKLRSFSVTDDVRIIYLPTKQGVIFLDIGTHQQVYQS